MNFVEFLRAVDKVRAKDPRFGDDLAGVVKFIKEKAGPLGPKSSGTIAEPVRCVSFLLFYISFFYIYIFFRWGAELNQRVVGYRRKCIHCYFMMIKFVFLFLIITIYT